MKNITTSLKPTQRATQFRRLRSAAVVVFSLLLAIPDSVAQEAHHPQVAIVHQGVGRLKSDIKALLDLATDEERHWENWDGVIELFAFGLDFERPVRVDVLSGLTPAPSMIYGPYTDPVDDLLHENLEGADYVPQKISDTLYELLPPEQGWFRVLPDQKYAILLLSEPKNHNLLKQLILKAIDPLPVINEVLQGGANLGVQLVNKAETSEDQKKRRDSFAEIRAVRMDALQQRPSETATAFELRKGFLDVNLSELERLMVEASRAISRTTMPADASSATISFEAEAIPETSLSASIGLFGKHKDAFAAIAKAQDSALSLRINHPIDDLRQANSLKIIELMSKDVTARLSSSDTKLTTEQKEAAQKAFDDTMTVVKDGIATGNLNAFMESIASENGDLLSYGAMAASNAGRLNDVLALVAKTHADNESEMDVAKVGDVRIHRIKLKKGFLELYDNVFGDNAEVFVGVADSIVWFSTGPGALDTLKEVIPTLQEPADSDVILRSEWQLLPWAQRAKKTVEGLPEPTTLDDQQAQRDVLLRLTQATEALTEKDDDARFDMKVKDGVVTGEIFFNQGALRFVGTQLVTFSKNNLE